MALPHNFCAWFWKDRNGTSSGGNFHIVWMDTRYVEETQMPILFKLVQYICVILQTNHAEKYSVPAAMENPSLYSSLKCDDGCVYTEVW